MDRWYQGALVLPDRVVEDGLLRVEGGRITGLWDRSAGPSPVPPPDRTVRLERGWIAPGFIDVHVHGGGGADFMDCDPEAVATITATHARGGTTGLLATTLTAPEEEIRKAIRAAREAPRRGARVLGYHVEGPFVNPKWKGAQNPQYVRLPSVEEVDRWLAEGDADHVWRVTLAPEMEGALDVIWHLARRGVVVSAGHTDCTYAQIEAAKAAGVVSATHLFNAMRGLHHREPGTVGAVLLLPGLMVELIADGLHVHPGAMALAVKVRGPENVMLVTDAMMATGLPDGTYSLGGLSVTVNSGEARLADGTLASSVLTMDGAVRNMVELVGLPLHAAVAMASLNPARQHGLDRRKGSLAVGKDADLVLLDEKLNAVMTVVEGTVVHDGR